MKLRKKQQRNFLYNQCQVHERMTSGMPQDDCPMCLQSALERVLAGKEDIDHVLEPEQLVRILHRLLLETNINAQFVEHLRHEEQKAK